MSRWGRLAAVAAACAAGWLGTPAAAHAAGPATTTPIRHFIYLMQGGRTFDDYFGTYPGADGFPAGACQSLGTSAQRAACVKPYPLHGQAAPTLAAGSRLIANQLDGGKMDAFVSAYERQGRDGTSAMGYYDRTDLPTSWAAADQYVLFDRFFSDAAFGTVANRSYWISGAPAADGGNRIPAAGLGNQPTIFDRLQAAGVSWKFYVQGYNPAHTFRAPAAGRLDDQATRVPVLDYARFLDDPRLRGRIVDLSQYYRDLAAGTLPAVAYVATSGADERSARSIPAGQRLIQTMINQLMVSSSWSSSAFFWSYEQSGGWYDQVVPPRTPTGTLGLRVPALLVSPYARRGMVDHAQTDPTSALRFIETNWRLPSLTARDAGAGDLTKAFDFTAAPRKARLLPGYAALSASTAAGAPARTHVASRLYGVTLALCLALVLGVALSTWWRTRRADKSSHEQSADAADDADDAESRPTERAVGP
ncbi:MAG TPA: alkaline phosphatase family protein [Actinospica sp.]|nr:alkaline phosphatase family protein [Actinospica sp.]